MPDAGGARLNIARASAGKPGVDRTSAAERLAVAIVDERGRSVAAPGLAAWLRRVAPSRARGAVSIALISDRRVRALNKMYRRKDYATDVLSFPATAGPALPETTHPKPRALSTFLGDI